MSAIDVEKRRVEYPLTSVNTSLLLRQQQSPPSSHQKSVVDEKTLVSQKIADALAERDAYWRKHERDQVDFMREQNGELMAKMHVELERLHMANRELERRLYVEERPQEAEDELEQLKSDLATERDNSTLLRHELGLAVKRSARLAQMLEKNSQAHKEEVAKYEEKMADLQEQIRRLKTLLLVKAKSRSIGPTRIHAQRRSQSGDSRAANPSSEWLMSTDGRPARGKDDRQQDKEELFSLMKLQQQGQKRESQ